MIYTDGDFTRFIAYPYEFVEPYCENRNRNDGEDLLPRLRTFWKLVGDEYIAGAILGSLSSNVKYIDFIRQSLMDCKSSVKPLVRLVRVRCLSVNYKANDMNCPTPELHNDIVCIQNSNNECIMRMPPSVLPKPSILVKFDRQMFSTIQGSSIDAQMEIRLCEDEIQVDTVSFAGTRKKFSIKLSEFESYASLFSTDYIQLKNEHLMLPKTPSELPFKIQRRFAEFWNNDLRAASLARASKPHGCVFARELCFSSVTLSTVGKNANQQRTVMKGTIHQSSSSCICASQSFDPIQKRFPKSTFSGSEVTMNISMCGRRLRKMSPDAVRGECPLHGGGNHIVDSIPDICCHETTCNVSCAHFTTKKEFKPGVCIRSIPLDDVNLLHAQILVSSAIRSANEIAPMLGKRKNDEIYKACQRHSEKLDHKLESIKRFKSCRNIKHTEEELQEMDSITLKLLKKGRTFQKWVKSKRQTVLVTKNPKNGQLSALSTDYEPLNYYHKWMFPRVQC